MVGPNRWCTGGRSASTGGVNLPKRAPVAVRSDDEACGMAATVGSVGSVAKAIDWLAPTHAWAGQTQPLRVGYGYELFMVQQLKFPLCNFLSEKKEEKHLSCHVRYCCAHLLCLHAAHLIFCCWHAFCVLEFYHSLFPSFALLNWSILLVHSHLNYNIKNRTM